MKQAGPGARLERIAALLREELASLLLSDVKDPVARQITLTTVKVTRDLSIAKVYYLPLMPADPGTRAATQQRREIERALGRLKGFLRHALGQRLTLRVIPQLRFYWDDAVEHGRKMDAIFDELAQERADKATEADPEAQDAEMKP
ncbi:MAG: 30S ribosome-binding factor RbfA [Myxococcota bacterium]